MAPTSRTANAKRNDDRCDGFAVHDPTEIQPDHIENRIHVSLPAPVAANREVIRRR